MEEKKKKKEEKEEEEEEEEIKRKGLLFVKIYIALVACAFNYI